MPFPHQQSVASLLDAADCGENLLGNAERVLAIAPRLCADCMDYHVRSVLHRASGIAKGIAIDRAELADSFCELTTARGTTDDPLDILVAGAADTGILATCVQVMARLGLLQRVRFVVADRCATPLDLCSSYARRYGIALETRLLDLLTDGIRGQFDIVVMHSVLRFIPLEKQAPLLAKLGAALKDDGFILLSQRFMESGGNDVAKRKLADSVVLKLIRSGRIACAMQIEEVEALLMRSREDAEIRPGEMGGYERLSSCIREAGLTMRQVREVERHIPIALDEKIAVRRIIAVLQTAVGRSSRTGMEEIAS